MVQSMDSGVLHGRFVVQVDEMFNAGASQAQRYARPARLLGAVCLFRLSARRLCHSPSVDSQGTEPRD